MKILNNKILIKPEKLIEETEYGIIIVRKEDEKPVIGTVEIGNNDLKKGDKVLFSKFGYDEVKLENEIYYIISMPNILAIL